MIILMFVLAALLIVIPFLPPVKRALQKLNPRLAVFGNIGVFAIFAIILTVFVFSGNAAAAGEVAAEAGGSGLANGLGYLAAALSTGMSTIGAGIAVAAGASAAIGATSEDPKMLSKGLIFVALGEGIVLYGLLMSFMILNQLG